MDEVLVEGFNEIIGFPLNEIMCAPIMAAAMTAKMTTTK